VGDRFFAALFALAVAVLVGTFASFIYSEATAPCRDTVVGSCGGVCRHEQHQLVNESGIHVCRCAKGGK